jgi:A/G-specific adenine glycosylase
VKEKKLKIKTKYFNYIVIVTSNNKTIFEERIGKGIWEGLYQFPLIETNKEVQLDELINLSDFKTLVLENSEIKLFNTKTIIHKLSHQHLHTNFWIIKSNDHQDALVSWQEIETFPVSILIANFLKEFTPKLNNFF